MEVCVIMFFIKTKNTSNFQTINLAIQDYLLLFLMEYLEIIHDDSFKNRHIRNVIINLLIRNTP